MKNCLKNEKAASIKDLHVWGGLQEKQTRAT